MEVISLGHSSFKLKGKQAVVVTDPFDETMVGMRFPKVERADIVTISHHHGDHNKTDAVLDVGFVVDGPGEYEISGVTIKGVGTHHDTNGGKDRGGNVVYNIYIDEIRVCHLGDLGHKLTEDQVSRIGQVDVLLVPVGGFYTISADVAQEVVAQLEPRIVVPMHYRTEKHIGETFASVDPLEKFLKQMGQENILPINKLTLSADKLPETTTIVVLEG